MRVIAVLCFVAAPFVALWAAWIAFYTACALGFELAIETWQRA